MQSHPVKFAVDYPEGLSRGKLLLRAFFGWAYVGIPHGVILSLYGAAVGFVTFIAWWTILFTGKYPRGMFDFVVQYMRWALRVTAYMSLKTDIYPPFSGEPTEEEKTLAKDVPPVP